MVEEVMVSTEAPGSFKELFLFSPSFYPLTCLSFSLPGI